MTLLLLILLNPFLSLSDTVTGDLPGRQFAVDYLHERVNAPILVTEAGEPAVANLKIEVQVTTPSPVTSQNVNYNSTSSVNSGNMSGNVTGNATGTVSLYNKQQLTHLGVVNWAGKRFTYYSQRVLPGGGLHIPGRHIQDGYVTDQDGFIVLANDKPLGTVIPTPFGRPGKVYDRGTQGEHYDIYTE